MPRRNQNADYYRPRDYFYGRILPTVLWDESSKSKTPTAKLKVTGDSIVREYRRNWEEAETRNISRSESDRIYAIPTKSKCSWWRKINWGVIFNWACWIAVVGCLIYLGVVVFAPFTVKMLWK